MLVRIGELADTAGVATTTVRFYEAEGLLNEPGRTGSGYRDYAPEAIDRLGFIRHAQAAGLSLRQIREVLRIRDDGHAPCQHVADLVDERLGEVDQRLDELAATRAQLVALKQRLTTLDPADCPPAAVCRGISRP